MELRELMQNIDTYLGKTVELDGWVKKNRDQKNFGFIEFNDGTKAAASVKGGDSDNDVAVVAIKLSGLS